MTRPHLLALAVTGSGLLASSAMAATLGTNATAYALGNEGRTLVTVATPGGGAATGVTLSFAGGAMTSLDALAFRPMTGQLYGYDDEGDTVYEVNMTTGVATAVVTNMNATTNDDLGFDFNNVLDAARIVTAEEENVVFFPNNAPPTLEPKTKLAFVAGDPNEGANPNIVMNAYTNAVPMATSTTQYVIDSDWNILATLGNNAGTLETVGELFLDDMPFDLTEDGGFDILSFSEGDNTAFALLTMGGMQAIYEVPLMADGMGRVNLSFVTAVDGSFGTLDGFAVVAGAGGPNPSLPPVPVPASLGLLGTGVAVLAAWRRFGSRRA